MPEAIGVVTADADGQHARGGRPRAAPGRGAHDRRGLRGANARVSLDRLRSPEDRCAPLRAWPRPVRGRGRRRRSPRSPGAAGTGRPAS
jgi:hypothetical protein